MKRLELGGQSFYHGKQSSLHNLIIIETILWPKCKKLKENRIKTLILIE
jgi:hypothetical protein